jgi:hypothetical protein
MTITTKARVKLPGLGALSIAAGLALSAGASVAGVATVNITSFTATADVAGTYVSTTDSFQNYVVTALDAGGLTGASQNSYSANDWNLGLNRTASTAYSTAGGNTVQFTDPATNLLTAGFDLNATARRGGIFLTPTLPNSANATGLQQGIFTLLDGNGDAVAGSITFDLYYDLAVSTTIGNPPADYTQAQVNLLASDDAGESANFSDGLLSYTQPGGVGSISGHFSRTFNLAAGDSAYYTLSGTAFAAADVPEPGSLALSSLALVALCRAGRKHKTGVATA